MKPYRPYILCLAISFLATAFTSCTRKEQNSFNGDIRHIPEFMTEQILRGEKLPYIRNIGFYGCDLIYPYLLLSLEKQDSLLGVYDVERKEFLGNLFTYGPGPDEYNTFVIVNQHNDSTLTINDIYKKRLRMLLLSESISRKRPAYHDEVEYEGIHELIFHTDSLIWMKNTGNGRITYTCSNPDYPEKTLYKEKIDGIDLDNMLLLSDALKPDGSKLVSLTGILDQIDVLSLTSAEKNFSATTSTRPITLEELQEKNYEYATDYYLALPRCNDQYIMALHVSPKTRRKSLHMIDWQGNGIADYSLNEDIIDFCVDWKRNAVYGITPDEEVYEYRFVQP